ncbi:MAG: TRAP transporter small permease [Planctomycetes bacterium]|nr:TRAP transporter small permease [Planctomycetota bacterium]
MQNSLSWSEELARYLFILFVYAGISYGVKKKRHIKVEVFTMWLPMKAQIYIRIISDLLFLVFAVLVIYFGAITASRILALNQVSPALDIPMGFVSATLPICYVLTTIRLLQNLHASVSELVGAKSEGEK